MMMGGNILMTRRKKAEAVSRREWKREYAYPAKNDTRTVRIAEPAVTTTLFHREEKNSGQVRTR